jgi:hypothetical protein
MRTTIGFEVNSQAELDKIGRILSIMAKGKDDPVYTCQSRLKLIKDIRSLIKEYGAGATLVQIKDVVFRHVTC